MNYKDYLGQSVSIAESVMGTTSPNPAVGAIIVKDGTIVGQGHTQPPGGDHAEVVAILQAGQAAQGASLYVSLEPCCFQGRTPPCTNAIINSGIKEVIFATVDHNPKVSGRGIDILRESGIRITHETTYENSVRTLYEGFFKHVTTGLPFLTAKFAMTLDGKIATHTGDSKWISDPTSRQRVHIMRKFTDVVMVGINTVLVDNPRLTARPETPSINNNQPIRIIVDSHARTPPNSAMLKEPGTTIIATTKPKTPNTELLKNAGAEIMTVPPQEDGKVDLNKLLDKLGQRGIVNILAEGGGTLFGSLFDLGLIDKVTAFVSPILIGGDKSPSPIQGSGRASIASSNRLENLDFVRLDNDILVTGYPSSGKSIISNGEN